jgi:hypothetical protein
MSHKCFCFQLFFQIGSCGFAWAGLRPWFSYFLPPAYRFSGEYHHTWLVFEIGSFFFFYSYVHTMFGSFLPPDIGSWELFAGTGLDSHPPPISTSPIAGVIGVTHYTWPLNYLVLYLAWDTLQNVLFSFYGGYFRHCTLTSAVMFPTYPKLRDVQAVSARWDTAPLRWFFLPHPQHKRRHGPWLPPSCRQGC